MSVTKAVVLSVIWVVGGAVAIVMKDVSVLGYALVGSLIVYLGLD